MRDRVFRTRFYAKTAKNTSPIVDIINFCEPLVAADTLGIRPWIGLRFDIDAVRGTRGGAEITRYAVFYHVQSARFIAFVASFDAF